jgi:hypothetical protein
MVQRIILIGIFVVHLFVSSAQKGTLTGTVKDKQSTEALQGATVKIAATSHGSITDENGEYEIILPVGTYDISVSYVSFHPVVFAKVEIQNGKTTRLDVLLEAVMLQDVTIRETALRNTESAVVNAVRTSSSVANGVSAQEISQTQDRNAAEVIRRIPGVVVSENRFVNVRGLSQRYNGVYLNQAPTPSSETDIRAFAFDVLPGSQIDNMMVIKSPMAHLPADFSGGFVQIQTKNTTEENGFSVNYSLGYRAGTSFTRQLSYRGSPSDWTGFGAGMRKLPADFPQKYNNIDAAQQARWTQQLNGYWKLSPETVLPDQRFSFLSTVGWKTPKAKISQVSALNYSHTSQVQNLFNARYGIYNTTEDRSVFLKQYNDTACLTDSRLSGLLNWSFLLNNGDKLEWSNFFNQSGRKRTTVRSGTDYSNDYQVLERELYYSSRTTYSGQLAGEHCLRQNTQRLTYGVSYSFASKQEPDRRIIVSRQNTNPHSVYYGQYATDGSDIGRHFQQLSEHIAYANAHYEAQFKVKQFRPTVSAGLSLEYRGRNFQARNFTYDYGDNRSRPNYLYMPYHEMLSPPYLHAGATVLSEKTNKSDSYDVLQWLPAVYGSVKIPFLKKMEAYLGVRYESHTLILNSYESDGVRPVRINKTKGNFFPSASLIYHITSKHLLRAGYGYSVNRPEFRELAPYVYYDFDWFAHFEGNPQLKNAYIQNVDFRYEFYPSAGEMISAGIFYKSFQHPIEITYFYTGGQLQYSFANAQSARNIGAEVEIRMNLDKIGLKDFSLVANAAWIDSRVRLPENEIISHRAMQGQSPFLVNAALFFRKEAWGLNASLQYNIIGKRIVVLGEAHQDPTQYIPDTYEMPRHTLDFSIRKRVGKHTEISLGVKDMLGQKVVFKQFPVTRQDGKTVTREQITRCFTAGQVVSAALAVKW